MRITIVLALTLFGLGLLGFCNTALAKENDIGYSKIHPASPLYFLKSVREILELKFSKPDQIGLKYFEFAQRRIREVKSLISVNRPDLIPPTLEKYSANLNKTLGPFNFQDEALSNEVINNVGMHIVKLEEIYHQTQNPKAKIALRLAIYRISLWNEQLLERLNSKAKDVLSLKINDNQTFICNFLSKEASSSALNQTERVVLIERAQKCKPF